MNSQSHALISSPVRQTIQITTHRLISTPVRHLILIIDPDEVFLQLIKQVFSAQYQVFTAHDLEEATKLLRRCRFDLLLLDLNTPMADGIGMLTKICTHPRLRQIPLLALSTSDELRKRLEGLDIVAVVPKARWLDNLAYALEETIRLSNQQARPAARENLAAAKPERKQPLKVGAPG